MRVGLLTCDKFPHLWDDDQLAATELRRRGHEVVPVSWTRAPTATLDTFDVVVMRNPWDWFHHRDAFRRFIATELTQTRARVVNPQPMLAAFADKTYLAKLAAKNVAVVPTVELTRETLHRLPSVLTERNWKRAVLKPAFTANAVGAQVFDAAECDAVLARAAEVPLADGEVWLVQPFVPSIATGEYSFIFFGGVFSHAVHKRPKSGDWRVQHDYGGESSPFQPTRAQIDEATALLAQAAPGSTYGRVDAVDWQGRLHVMELELVEPELFFRHEPSAAARFAEALLP